MGDVAGARVEIHYDETGWAGLYVDGRLHHVGDSHVCEEQAFTVLGVHQVHDDAFMRGQTDRAGAAETLADVVEFRTARERAAGRAAELRARAAALLAEADTMDAPRP